MHPPLPCPPPQHPSSVQQQAAQRQQAATTAHHPPPAPTYFEIGALYSESSVGAVGLSSGIEYSQASASAAI